mgnify:CR=1 FL=1
MQLGVLGWCPTYSSCRKKNLGCCLTWNSFRRKKNPFANFFLRQSCRWEKQSPSAPPPHPVSNNHLKCSNQSLFNLHPCWIVTTQHPNEDAIHVDWREGVQSPQLQDLSKLQLNGRCNAEGGTSNKLESDRTSTIVGEASEQVEELWAERWRHPTLLEFVPGHSYPYTVGKYSIIFKSLMYSTSSYNHELPINLIYPKQMIKNIEPVDAYLEHCKERGRPPGVVCISSRGSTQSLPQCLHKLDWSRCSTYFVSLHLPSSGHASI